MAKCDVRVIPLNPGEQSSAIRYVLLRGMNIQCQFPPLHRCTSSLIPFTLSRVTTFPQFS